MILLTTGVVLRQKANELILPVDGRRLVSLCLNCIAVWIRFILLIFGGQKQVALENAALRQQLAVCKRDVGRPKLNDRDRLFWIGLRMIWRDWKSALVIVRPETVISWHRKRFKRYYPQTDLYHGDRQSDMGCATGTRRIEKAGISDFGTNRVALDADEDRQAVSDLDDVSSESRRPNGFR